MKSKVVWRTKSTMIAARGPYRFRGFPQFDALLRSLKEGSSHSTAQTFNVCTLQQSKLIILQSLASKFVNAEATKDAAIEAINNHNSKYNEDGCFWEEDERTGLLSEVHDWMNRHMFLLLSPVHPLPVMLINSSRNCDDRAEPPAKRIKLEPTDMFKEEDVNSLPKPTLVYKLRFSLLCGWILK